MNQTIPCFLALLMTTSCTSVSPLVFLGNTWEKSAPPDQGMDEWNMVVVRMGEDGHPEDKNLVYGTFLGLLGESILDNY